MNDFCNSRRKLFVLVWPEGHPKAGEIVAACSNSTLDDAEIGWGDFSVSFGQEESDGTEAVPVAIVECDGSSELDLERIGTGDGKDPECRIEACMEVSVDRSSPQDLPISNTFAQARSLVRCAREQDFPMRQPHHRTHDHKRLHCIGRLVRK